MGLGVVTNSAAMHALRALSRSSDAMSRSLERLSTGYRVNRAADDAAGLAVSEGLRSSVGGLAQAARNTRDGISLLQTAEGALTETTAVLQRMRDLAVQGANAGGLDVDATAAIQAEMGRLKDELTRIATTTSFNGTRLLDGRYTGTFQVGADAGDTLTVGLGSDMGARGLGVAALNFAAVRDPEVSGSPAQGRVDHLRTGAVVFIGATAAPGGIAALSGTLSLDGHSLDLGSMAYTSGDLVAQLNAAALAAGFTHRPDPFVDDGDDLIFRGVEPTAGATAAQLAAASPTYTGPPTVEVVVAPASTSDPPQAGLLTLPGIASADLPTLRGSITANGRTLELGAVDYTDTDGDGAIGGDEALAQLNAAARAAGVIDASSAFVESRLITLDEDQYVDSGTTLHLRGTVPADDATAAELTALSPVFSPAQDMIAAIDGALGIVSAQRAQLGAVQNRFEHTLARVGVAAQNAAASLARIRDTDLAAETTWLVSSQVRLQAATAMLSQANQSPQRVLTLLGT